MRGVVDVGGWEFRIATNGISNRHFSTSFAPPFTPAGVAEFWNRKFAIEIPSFQVICAWKRIKP